MRKQILIVGIGQTGCEIAEKISHKFNKKFTAKSVLGYLFMVLGCAFYAFSTILFLAPNQIVAGGVTGLSVLINIINNKIPIGTISIIINIPILYKQPVDNFFWKKYKKML